MIVVRNTQHAKYGMGDALVELMREFVELLSLDKRVSGCRVLTDIDGRMFTVETEFQVKSLAEFEQIQAELFSGAAFRQWFGRIQPLIEQGHRSFLTVRADVR